MGSLLEYLNYPAFELIVAVIVASDRLCKLWATLFVIIYCFRRHHIYLICSLIPIVATTLSTYALSTILGGTLFTPIGLWFAAVAYIILLGTPYFFFAPVVRYLAGQLRDYLP